MPGLRFFSLDYGERAVLRDGTQILLRLVTPEDKELLRAGFDRLSPESRYARFLAPKSALSDEELRYLCEIDQENHVAIGAVRYAEAGRAEAGATEAGATEAGATEAGATEAGATEAGATEAGATEAGEITPVGLGIARFIRLADAPTIAEAAIAVADETQHQGLGTLLFLRLVAAAAERGVERFRCEILGSNTGMAGLLAQISPDRSIEVDSGRMSIEIALPNVTPTQPPAGAPLQSPMYRLFRAAAQNAVEWTNAVRNLWRR